MSAFDLKSASSTSLKEVAARAARSLEDLKSPHPSRPQIQALVVIDKYIDLIDELARLTTLIKKMQAALDVKTLKVDHPVASIKPSSPRSRSVGTDGRN